MKDYVALNYGVDNRRNVVVPPGGRILHNKYIERPGPPKIVYAGMVSYRKHVDLFVKSIGLVKSARPDAQFYITKKGDLLKRIQDLA